jgi:hypothetical protein
MAKQAKTSSVKLTFGKRKVGRHKKRSGPKDKAVKVYNKQGR